MKTCPRCKRELPLTEFAIRGPSRAVSGERSNRAGYCKKCSYEVIRPYSTVWNRNKLATDPEYRARQVASAARGRLKLKLETIAAYGGKCACCGEARWPFLSLDHINGGGTKERRTTAIHGGVHLYRYLRQHGWPDGFRILCHNCNQAIGFHGQCPHTGEL